MKYDAVIVLSHLTEGDMPSEEGKARIDKAIEILNRGEARVILMSGNRHGKIPQNVTHAQAMKNYAISRGVNPNAIFKEEVAVDTTYEAVHVKRLSKPRGWRKLAIVSSDYHMKRIKYLFDFAFGNGYKLSYFSAKTNKNTPEIQAKQMDSYRKDRKLFRGVKKGDDEKMLQRILKRHPLYMTPEALKKAAQTTHIRPKAKKRISSASGHRNR